jgi:hypothetical protein
MSFQKENVSDFKSSLSYLITSMMETNTFITSRNIFGSKPSYAVQTEKFFSFYEKVMGSSAQERDTLLENLRTKVVTPFYEAHSVSFMSNLVGEDGKVDDTFLKISEDSGDSIKIKTTPSGMFFQIAKVFLPISEVYSQAVKISLQNKGENISFPNKILLGLYTTVFHAVRGVISPDVTEYFRRNSEILMESLEVNSDSSQKQPSDNGPLGIIKNMLGNIDFNQIGDMMSKVSGDEKSSKEFGEVFSKLSESIQSGKNPLDVMGDIIKNASMEAASEAEAGEEPQSEEQDTANTDPVETPVEIEEELPGSGLG